MPVPAKRLEEVVKLVRDTLGVEPALVVLASIKVAQARWTEEDTVKYGYITRDHLFNKGEFAE